MTLQSRDTSQQRTSDWHDRLRFLRSLLSDPRRVAAIAPSGRALARLMTREIDAATAPVLELGPGTGIFTQALLDRGVPPDRLTLVEFGAEFIVPLRRRFPDVRVVHGDAARLVQMNLFPPGGAGAVVSGLPLLSMPSRKVMAILRGAFGCLRDSGAFFQFTYGPRCPVPEAMLDRLDLRAERIGGTFRNLPPASVYRLSRRTEMQ